MNRTKRRLLTFVAAGAVIAVVSALALGMSGQANQEAADSAISFSDVQAQTMEFHAYNREIELTSQQEAIMRQALTGLKAPCCSDRTAYTCCCECNMKRSWFGLAKHLIANEGLGAEEVRTAVKEWFEFINPDGFSGSACYMGQCSRPFGQNGCGGMKEDNVIF